ncbi:MAG: GMC family oxidoreductase [Deltaproteobacteria bacterium]|nr:GMC family oxidoreductase [Deltaproteobacteria bacterium]
MTGKLEPRQCQVGNLKNSYENIVIGSGFGGGMVAYALSKAGQETLVVDRGVWVRRDETCWDEKALHLDTPPLYQGKIPFNVDQKRGGLMATYPYETVGGMSTFYGGVSLRLRESDFKGEVHLDSLDSNSPVSKTAWPFHYQALAPYYDEAENILGVAGALGEDITEPARGAYPQGSFNKLSPPSQRVWDAARKMGLHPCRLPMAINLDGAHGQGKCVLCNTCDYFICKVCAKNDLSLAVLPSAMKNGAEILDQHGAVKIEIKNGAAQGVVVLNLNTGMRRTIKTKRVILACGAITTPQMLLVSGVDQLSPAGKLIGRCLMRHINGVMAGAFTYRTNVPGTLQKMIGIPDFYHGDPLKKSAIKGPWGLLQEIGPFGKGLIMKRAPFGFKHFGAFFRDRLTNLLCIAADGPQYNNRVYVQPDRVDQFGVPLAQVYHRYHPRDYQVLRLLCGKAREILREVGAFYVHYVPIETFSHAFGTCRMGNDPASSVTDPLGQVWGVKNLVITDASLLPYTGSVNPSLTIAANALRIGQHLIGE